MLFRRLLALFADIREPGRRFAVRVLLTVITVIVMVMELVDWFLKD